MKLLLTNDDGIAAPGLVALDRASRDLGIATVVAPTEAQSGCSHRTTTHRPLAANKLGADRFAVDGAPADCVRLGLVELVREAEWVLSGINEGGNLGVDIYMSGTIAAVREAALLGRKGIAVSHYRRNREPVDWEWAAAMTRDVLRQIVAKPYDEPGYWNVNLPDPAGTDGKPQIVFCEPDSNPLPIVFKENDGKFQFNGNYHERPRKPSSDVDICFSGDVSVSFIRLGWR